MIILGVDPALSVTGFGAIKTTDVKLGLLEAGIISTSCKYPTAQRLDKIYQAMVKLIEDIKPDCLVLEKIFSHYKHPATAFVLGQARGVICLAAQAKNILLVEYAATRVKKAIVGNGLASKSQVQRMVAQVLNLKELPQPLDVSDALGLAIAHSYIGEK